MALFGDNIGPGMELGLLTALGFSRILNGHSVWLFRCRCGQEVEIRAESVRRGNTSTCGKNACLIELKRSKSTDPEKGARNYVLRYYRTSAQSRGVEYQISEARTLELFKMPCHYCGVPPSAVSRPRRSRRPFLYNGIDRVDNSQGYTDKNTVPCCKTCNYMKQSLSVDEFRGHIRAVYEHLFNQPGSNCPLNCKTDKD